MEKLPNKNTSSDEKLNAWDKMTRLVDGVVDARGTAVDRNIHEAVVAFNCNGFVTEGSCEGHPDDHGLPYPWVDISSKLASDPQFRSLERRISAARSGKEPVSEDERKMFEQLKEEVTTANLKEKERLEQLLNEFYQTNTSPEHIFEFETGTDGKFRLKPVDTPSGSIKESDAWKKQFTRNELAEKLKKYQADMNTLAAFLKYKYFT